MASRRVLPKDFYVYTHARPDGSVFYVGKGYGRRSKDFAPSRRTKHHRNIALKYGLQNILVVLVRPGQQAANERKSRDAQLKRGVPSQARLPFGEEG